MKDIEKINWLFHKERIIEKVLRFNYAMDLKNWQMLRNCLSDELEIDYSDFSEDSPRNMSVNEFIEWRKRDLDDLQTHHTSTNHIVSINGNKAECVSNFLIYRVGFDRTGRQSFFNTMGNYNHGFERKKGIWLINRITQNVFWTNGNRETYATFHNL